MLGLMRLGSYCCKCEPPTSAKRIAGLIDLAALIAVPLIITLAGNKIPMGPLNKLVEPLGVGAKYGLFFIVTPIGGVVIFCIYKSWKMKETSNLNLSHPDFTKEDFDNVKSHLSNVRFDKNDRKKNYGAVLGFDLLGLPRERLTAVLDFLYQEKVISEYEVPPSPKFVYVYIKQEKINFPEDLSFNS